jgi:putative ABC transport system substrate-binding protein
LAGLALAACGFTSGCGLPLGPWQQAARIPRIGYLGGGSSGPYPALLNEFRWALHELGYVEGQTIAIDYRFIDESPERAPAFAAELVGLNLDLIVANGAAQAAVLKARTATVPIVGVPLGGDPVGVGLVESLARPGGNVTGLSTVAGGTVTKRLQLLREATPSTSRVAVLWNPGNATKAAELKEAQAAAESLGLQLLSTEIRRPEDFEAAFQAVAEARADALALLAEPLANAHSARIAAFAIQQRLPSIHELRDFTDAGGLMSYGPNLTDLFRRAAVYVSKILKGTKPADLPVEQPTTFDLVINLRSARALGLTIPQSVLMQATEVFS